MIAMRHQETDRPATFGMASAAAVSYALPDAPLAMPMQVIERSEGLMQRLFASLRSSVPAQGN